MTESKKLKTPCGTSCMCCACINPWVFYTEMLIIIIVLEHFYLPKRLPCTCSPTMEREQWETTEAASGKGRKIVTSLEKHHQFLFKQIFSWLQCEEKTSLDLLLFPSSCYKQIHDSISDLQFFEELKWQDGSSEAGIFSLSDWTVTGLAMSKQVFFPYLWMLRVYWHCDIAWEFIQLPCRSK